MQKESQMEVKAARAQGLPCALPKGSSKAEIRHLGACRLRGHRCFPVGGQAVVRDLGIHLGFNQWSARYLLRRRVVSSLSYTSVVITGDEGQR